MKDNTSSRRRSDPLHRLIQNAAGASAKDLEQIESIMRDEIFHSTLDWQTPDQLAAAARQAFARLNKDRNLYDLDHACRVALFHKMWAESSLRKHNTSAKRAAVADAVAKYETAKTKLITRLDEITPH